MKSRKNLFFCVTVLFAALFSFPVFGSKVGDVVDRPLQQVITQNDGIIKVQGHVQDENGEPIIGATIQPEDLSTGVISNTDGNYYLLMKKKPTSILVSYLGYKSKLIKYEGQATINVILEEDSKILNEVVVTGYQTISQDRATGAYGILSTKEMDKKIALNGISTIEGKVAGLSTYGDNIVIRGASTMAAGVGTKPLIVIDGLPTERTLNDINMNDVESFTVLKDAAATSIYGVRAANGVVVISTKKGEKGKTKIQFVSTWQETPLQPLSLYHYASTGDILDYEARTYKKMINEYKGGSTGYFSDMGDPAKGNIAYVSPYTELQRQLFLGRITQTDFDTQINRWKGNDYRQEFMDKALQDPFNQQYSLSLSNRSDRQNTYVSFQYTGNQKQLNVENNEQFKIYMKTTQQIAKWLKADIGIDITYGNSTDFYTTSGSYTNFGIMEPYKTMTDAAGNRIDMGYPSSTVGNGKMVSGGQMNAKTMEYLINKGVVQNFKPYYFNILDELENNTSNTKTLSTRSFLNLNADLYKGLKFSTSFGYETNQSNLYYVAGEDTYSMRFAYNRLVTYNENTKQYISKMPKGSYLRQEDTGNNNYTFRNQLDYKGTFNKVHDFSALAGVELRQVQSRLINLQDTYGFDSDALSQTWLDSYTAYTTGYPTYIYPNVYQRFPEPTTLNNNPSKLNRYVSLYATAGYSYKGRYDLTGSVRVDQANLFGTDPKYRYRPLWSVGAKWNIQKEKFMNDFKWINMLALRTSYGLTGNVDQTSSPYILAVSSNNNPVTTGINSNWVNKAPNPLLRWEKTDNYDFGMDFAFFKNMLSGKVDLYYKNSVDLLAAVDLDFSSGFTTATVNNGSMTNKGIEVTLNSPWFRKNDWELTSSVVFAYNKNKVTYLNKKASTADVQRTSAIAQGDPYMSLYAFTYGGLTSGHADDAVNGYPYVILADGTNSIKFDSNDKMIIANPSSSGPENAHYQGSLIPLWNGSFSQSVRYKNVELGLMFTYYGGNKMRLPSISTTAVANGRLHEDIVRAWTPENRNTDIPRMANTYPQEYGSNPATYLNTGWQFSNYNVVSGNLVRLNNTTISYSLPKKISEKMYMSDLKLSLQANNLWFWSAAGNDIDPETQARNSIERALPKATSYILRLDLTF